MIKHFASLVLVVMWLLPCQVLEAKEIPSLFDRNRQTSQQKKITSIEPNATLREIDPKVIRWIRTNVSPVTGLPLSFDIPQEDKERIYRRMGEKDSVTGIIERLIVEEGLVIYDGAVRQIVLTMLGGEGDLKEAARPIEAYWKGRVNELINLRAGYPFNSFIYDPNDPEAISSDLDDQGRRGFIFRIINAHGHYNTQDPLDGKTQFDAFPTCPTVHWEDWKPIAGENAWVAMAGLQLYHKKYFDVETRQYHHDPQAIELQLAQELARAAMRLQAENGGIRMAPIGTYLRERDAGRGWYDLISTENNLSWYAAFRMLYRITQDAVYREVFEAQEKFFQSAWDPQRGCFYQGMGYQDGRWVMNDEHFATDVQTWGILVLGPEMIDQWFGQGAAVKMWEAAMTLSGMREASGRLCGVGFTRENDRVSVEWSAGAIMAGQSLAAHYQAKDPLVSRKTQEQVLEMRAGLEELRRELPDDRAAYSYSSKRGWIPFGWFSHDPEVLSLASTAWIVLVDARYNPFYLGGRAEEEVFGLALGDF